MKKAIKISNASETAAKEILECVNEWNNGEYNTKRLERFIKIIVHSHLNSVVNEQITEIKNAIQLITE